MSKKLSATVALGLNATGFSKGLEKSKMDMDKFGKDVKRQNELASKFGAAGFGRGFGMAGGVFEGIAMGGLAGGLTAVTAVIGGMVLSMNAFMRLLDSVSAASVKARQTMEEVQAGKGAPGKLTGATELAAMAPMASARDVDVFAEQFASSFAPRAGDTILDAITNQIVADAPNSLRAIAGEAAGIAKDVALGRGSGDIAARLRQAAMNPTVFRNLVPDQTGNMQDARARPGVNRDDVLMGVFPQGRILQSLQTIEQAMRGN